MAWDGFVYWVALLYDVPRERRHIYIAVQKHNHALRHCRIGRVKMKVAR
jgi:hypothetical protein